MEVLVLMKVRYCLPQVYDDVGQPPAAQEQDVYDDVQQPQEQDLYDDVGGQPQTTDEIYDDVGTAQAPEGQGLCATALYDYQAGENWLIA